MTAPSRLTQATIEAMREALLLGISLVEQDDLEGHAGWDAFYCSACEAVDLIGQDPK